MNSFAIAAERTPLSRIAPTGILKELGLSLDAAAAEPFAYDCFGIVREVKTGNDGRGPWVQFRGEFLAVTPSREFTSARCHIPTDVQEQLHACWRMRSSPTDALSMAVRVRVVQAGWWTFSGKLLEAPQPFNALETIRDRVLAQLAPQVEAA